MAKKEELSFQAWAADFCLGGVAGAVSKTFTAPIERVKLLCFANELFSCYISLGIQISHHESYANLGPDKQVTVY